MKFIQTYDNFEIARFTDLPVAAVGGLASVKIGHNGCVYVAYHGGTCLNSIYFIRLPEDFPNTLQADWDTPVEIVADTVQLQSPGLAVTPDNVLFVSYTEHDYVADTDDLYIYKSVNEGQDWTFVSNTQII